MHFRRQAGWLEGRTRRYGRQLTNLRTLAAICRGLDVGRVE